MWRALLALGALPLALVAGLTGEAICHVGMCITALRENGTDSYTLTPRWGMPLETYGWVAMGWGTEMPNSPMVVMWPTKEGDFIFSHRRASGHIQPDLVEESSLARVPALDLSKTYGNATTVSFTFTVPSDDKGETEIIWAMGAVNPGSNSNTALLTQHLWASPEVINLNANYTAGEIRDVPGMTRTTKATTQFGKPAFVLIAHIVCGVLVTMIVLPGGVVVPRITRGLTTSRWWFYFHMLNQGVVALALVCAAFGIGLGFGKYVDTPHRQCGAALFALVLLQGCLGCIVHWYFPGPKMRKYTFETKRGRGPTNFLHVANGLVIVSVGWATCWYGFTDEWPRRGLGATPFGLRVGFGIILMIWIGLYLFGLAYFLPRQLQIESKERALELKDDRKYFRGNVVRTHFGRIDPRDVPLTPTPPLPSLSANEFSPSSTFSAFPPKSPRSPELPSPRPSDVRGAPLGLGSSPSLNFGGSHHTHSSKLSHGSRDTKRTSGNIHIGLHRSEEGSFGTHFGHWTNRFSLDPSPNPFDDDRSTKSGSEGYRYPPGDNGSVRSSPGGRRTGGPGGGPRSPGGRGTPTKDWI